MTLYSLCKLHGIPYHSIYNNERRRLMLHVRVSIYDNKLYPDMECFDKLVKLMKDCDLRVAFNRLEYEQKKENNHDKQSD